MKATHTLYLLFYFPPLRCPVSQLAMIREVMI